MNKITINPDEIRKKAGRHLLKKENNYIKIKDSSLNDYWFNAFGGAFDTKDEVLDFIIDRINFKDFKNSIIDLGGHGDPMELIANTADDKKELVREFLFSLI